MPDPTNLQPAPVEPTQTELTCGTAILQKVLGRRFPAPDICEQAGQIVAEITRHENLTAQQWAEKAKDLQRRLNLTQDSLRLADDLAMRHWQGNDWLSRVKAYRGSRQPAEKGKE